MAAVNMQQNNKKIFSMQLASSVNIQLLTQQPRGGATNGDVSVVRVTSSQAKPNAMPVLHEQPADDGARAMPVFRTQNTANGQKSMPISPKQQSPDGIKTMPVFRQQHGTTNGPTSTHGFAVQRTPSPVVTSVKTPAPQRVSASSTSSSEGGVTVVAINITGHGREATKAVKVTSNGSALPAEVHHSPPVMTSQPPVFTPEPAPPVVVPAPAPPVVVPQSPPSPPPSPTPEPVSPPPPPTPPPAPTPEPLSPPPPPPPPLPSDNKPTRIQLSRSVSLTRSPSSAEASRSNRQSPSSPNTEVNPFFRPLPKRVDPFSFSLMIKDGRRKLSNEAFRTSKFVKTGSGSGSLGGSGSSSSNADKFPLTEVEESPDRSNTDSANGASVPESTTGHSLPDIDGSSDSVFSDKSSDTSSTSSVEATLTDTPGGRCVRAVLASRRDLTVMLKVSCQSEKTASDQRVQALICRITAPCLEHFKKEKVQQLDLTAPDIMKLSMGDKPVKEYVAALSRDLGEDIIVSEAVCRKSTKKQYIGTSMNDVVYSEGNCQVAKCGVVVMLTKKNKLAPIQEFVDQLCRHVTVTKPTSLGSADSVILGRRPRRHEHINRTELLSQPFTYDPIISVAEAACRSFVEINNFALYE